jgi:hypothetical protein
VIVKRKKVFYRLRISNEVGSGGVFVDAYIILYIRGFDPAHRNN